jgi:3-isopropylmalate dehydrogenase
MSHLEVNVPVLPGDGSAPEQMAPASTIAIKAAELDGIKIKFIKVPGGWRDFKEYEDTFPEVTRQIVSEQKPPLWFFGGVGTKALDKAEGFGGTYPKMRPEGRCLLTSRDMWNLLINERPAIFYPELRSISRVADIANGRTKIPEGGIRVLILRYLLQGEYFGNSYFSARLPYRIRQRMGLKLKDEVTGYEPIISNIDYLTHESVEKFLRYAFARARELKMRLICVAKANVLPTHQYFWLNAQHIHKEEFPDVELREVVYSDDGMRLLAHPELLHGVVACTNKDGDMLSDGILENVGSMGLMYSSAINPETGAAMFESGSGTFPEAEGKNIANPIGRILSGGLMLEHICKTRNLGASNGAIALEKAVHSVLRDGYRTPDLYQEGIDDPKKRVGTREMGQVILSYLEKYKIS